MKRLKKLSEETIHDNPWWTYKHDTYEKPNGETGDYYYCDAKGYAMVIPVLEDGRIVLTLQHRYLANKQSIEFPAGGIEDSADALSCAKRELKEETGCVAEDFIKLGIFEPHNSMTKDTAHVFLAKVVEQGQQQLEDTEDIEILYRRPDEIDDMIKRNDIWDGETMAAWALARHHFFVEKYSEEKPALNPLHKVFDTLLDI